MVRAGKAQLGDRVLQFRLGDKSFSVPAEKVREVMRRPRITRVPHGPATLQGLMNFHGSAIAVVGLGALLGIGADASSSGERIIIFGNETPVGLAVDEVLRIDAASAGKQTVRRLDIEELLAAGFVTAPVARTVVARVADGVETGQVIAEDTRALLTFRVSGQRYALQLEAVSEALPLPNNVAVYPRSDATVLGLLELRDSVLPLVSLAGLLGLKEGAGRRNILVAIFGGRRVGLVVGIIDGVSRIPASLIEDVPPVLQRGEGDAEIDAIARVGGNDPLISILSPMRLFGNRDVAGAISLQDNAGPSDMNTSDQVGESLQFVIFQIGAESYGLPIAAVEEIVQLPNALTRVPKAPKFIAGVINLRGRALPVVDQRRRFEVGEAAGAGRPRVLVVKVGDLQAGFIVDAVPRILRVPKSEVTAAPSIPGESAKIFDRIAPASAGGEMILIVDAPELLDRAERDLLAKFQVDPPK